MIKKREKIGLKAEKAQAKELRGRKMKATNCEAGSCYCCFGRKLAEPAEFFAIRYAEIETQIRFRQNKHEHLSARVAFVLFTDRVTARIAARSQTNFRNVDFRYPTQKLWNVDPAPPLKTINWEWLHISHTQRWMRSLLVNAGAYNLVFRCFFSSFLISPVFLRSNSCSDFLVADSGGFHRGIYQSGDVIRHSSFCILSPHRRRNPRSRCFYRRISPG